MTTPGSNAMARLAAVPSNWRILNLFAASRALPESAGAFFHDRRLNGAIIVKHSLRDPERTMFAKPGIIATKVLVPLDPGSLSAGALSFFVGERAWPAIMRQTFGIDADRRPPERDVEILLALNRSPSLDAFLLRELVGGERFGIDPAWFDVSLLSEAEIRDYITGEMRPMVRFALGEDSQVKTERFVEAIFGRRPGTQSSEFLGTIGVPEPRRPAVIFAWKAALFYEMQFAAMQGRVEAMRRALAQVRTYGHSERYPRSYAELRLGHLAGFLSRAHERCRSAAAEFGSERRADIVARAGIGELRAYLEGLGDSVRGFGAQRAIVDHILSYWSFRTAGIEPERMPAELLCKVSADICAMEAQFAERTGGDGGRMAAAGL